MKRLGVTLLVLFSVLIGSWVGSGVVKSVFTTTPSQQTVVPATNGSLLDAVNAERAKVGVAPLVIHPSLQKSAQFKADDMWTRDYRAHADPITGKNNGLDHFFETDSSLCTYVSENFVYGADKGVLPTQSAVEWWLNSPSHKQAMLDPKYTYTGFGIAGNSVVVEHFCVAK